METMEEYKVVRLINEEPEFCEVEEANISASFFILCEERNKLFKRDIFDLQICGMSLVNWVVRVCGTQPNILKVKKGANALDVIRPYVEASTEYSVVFYADTPLLNKSHINDLLAFVDRKRMNVCKLKRGFVFRNEYISETDEIYSIDEYNFASNDFFVVDSSESFEFAKNILTKKLLDYHKKNGVFFENENTITIDANTEIGEGTKIFSGASIVGGSKVGSGSEISRNAVVFGSCVGNVSRVGANSVVIKSILKDSTIVQENVAIRNSVIGNDVKVDACSSVILSSIRDGVALKNNIHIENSKICEDVLVQGNSKILGIAQKTIIGAGSEIGACCKIIDSVISEQSKVENLTKINGRVDR